MTPAPGERRTPKAGKPVSRLVHERLARQVEALARHSAGAGLGSVEEIHDMRIACRRLRALLTTFGSVLDNEPIRPLRDEIRWIAGVLGGARDATVVHEFLGDLLDDVLPSQVHGPVRERMQATYEDHGVPELSDALASTRYLELEASLDALVLDPPWSELAGSTVREVAPRLLRKEVRRFARRTLAAAETEHATEAMHEARKAAKRLRYAAETLQPVIGEAARRLATEAKQVTTDLGELQDAAVARAELVQLAEAAAGAGEPTSTYGLLHARLEIRADQLTASFWATDVVGALDSRCRDAIRELG